MTAKTRYFVLAAFAILIGGLTTGLVASYLGGLPVALTKQAGPDDLAFVPPDATAVAYADVQQVMASELRQRLRTLHPDTSSTSNEFEEKTGVNVERDIDAVVAALLPRSGAERGEPRPLVLARGRFDQVRIEGLAREHGGEVSDYEGVRVVAHRGDRQTMALGFLAPGVVAVGSADGVKAAIDAKRSGRNVLSNTEMMRLVGELGSANAWAVGRFDAVAGSTELPGDLQQRMPTLSWFSASGHLNGGITGTLKAEAKDDEAATNLRDMLRGVVAMVKLQAGDKPEMRTFVDSLQLGGEGKTVAVGFSVPAELFELLEARKKGEARPAGAR
ncbi:MAG: hypothetical protein R2708_06505 [Vicinamibacterales bacterium]